jgi:hypothetical protein
MGHSKNIFMEERNFPYPEPINKVSNCCGCHDKLDYESGTTYSEMDICPECGDYCEFVTEEDFLAPEVSILSPSKKHSDE